MLEFLFKDEELNIRLEIEFMKILKIFGGIIIVIGACITLLSPFLLLIGLGMLDFTSDLPFGIELTEITGIVYAAVVFIVGAVIALLGKVLWERD